MPATFVQVAEIEGSEPIGLPTEDDGTLSMTTLKAQFPNCSGLKYIVPQTKTVRGVRVSVDDKLHPPPDSGWNSLTFYCVFTKKQTQTKLKCTNLKATTTSATLTEYFRSFGDVVAAKVNKDSKSAAITIIFHSDEAKRQIVAEAHEINGQLCHVELVNVKPAKNTPGVGADYEILVPAYFALLLNSHREVTNFTLRSNVSGFGNLDDLVIEVEIDGKRHYFCFQLKHKDDKDKMIGPTHFEAAGSFNLEQYLEAFRTLRRRSQEPDEDFKKLMKKGENRELFKNLKDELENYHLILYTNAHLNVGSKTKSMKKYSITTQDNLRLIDEIFNTSPESNDSKCVYKFVGGEEKEQFFSQFSFYANQKNVDGFRKGIFEILKDKNVALKYIDFFKRWHGEKFTNKTLDKETFNILILDIFASPFIATDRHFTKLELFERAIKTFDLTVVADSMENFAYKLPQWKTWNNLKELFSDEMNKQLEGYLVEFQTNPEASNSEKILSDCMLRLAKERKIVDRETKELNIETKLKVLRYFFDKLLIVDCNNNSRGLVYTALDLCRIKEIAVKLVLVGHEVDVAKYSHLTVFENLHDLEKEGSLYDYTIRTCTVSLQGRKEILLEQLVNNFERVGKFVKTKEIFDMVNGNCLIGGEKEVLPPHYVHRTVSTTLLDIETVFSQLKEKKDLLIINFDGKFNYCQHAIQNKEIQCLKFEDYLESGQSIENSIIVTNKEFSKNQFRNVCLKEAEKNRHIHFLKMVDKNSFMLVTSTKNTFLQTCNSIIYKKEEEIHDYLTNPVNILTAQPGMGKSTLLKYLTNKCPSDFWTVLVDLKAHNSFFQRDHRYDEVAENFIKPRRHNGDAFSDNLKAAFLQSNKMAWFLDGIDEMDIGCVGNVLKFIDAASAKGHRVWVSSRRSLQEMLETHFNTFPIGMEEFSEEEQKQYVEDRLRPKYKIEELRKIIDTLFDNTYIKQNAQMLGVPLQLDIITQILDDGNHYGNLKSNMFVSTKMYRLFCERKYKHLIEKLKSENNHLIPFTLEEQLKNYGVAALQSIFDDDVFAKLRLKIDETFLARIKTETDRLGFVARINDENKAVFVHLTFADHFACRFLQENKDIARLLIKEIFSERYKNLLLMFNIMISEESPLHLAVIHNDLPNIKNLRNAPQTDDAGRNPLHLVACNGTKHPFLRHRFRGDKWLVQIDDSDQNSFKGEVPVVKELTKYLLQQLDNVDSLLTKDDIFHLNPLQYAFMTGSLYVAEEMLKKYRTFKGLSDIPWDYCSVNIIYYSIRYGYPTLLSSVIDKTDFLIQNVKSYSRCLFENRILHFCLKDECENKTEIINILTGDNDNRIKHDDVQARDILLHCAVFDDNVDAIKSLLDQGAAIDSRNCDGGTPLHVAVKNSNSKALKFLLGKGPDVKAKVNGGKTALHCSLYDHLCEVEITELLLGDAEGLEVLNLTDDEGLTPLLGAAKYSNCDKLKVLLGKGPDLKAKATNEETVLHCAFFNEDFKFEIVELLLSHDEGLEKLLSTPNNNGLTILHYAIYEGRRDIVDLIFKHNIDLNLVLTNHPKYPLNFAREGDPLIREMLLEMANVIAEQLQGSWGISNERKIEILRQHFHTTEVQLRFGLEEL